ncbi:MAG: 3-ketoacyl-ACP reductase [Cyclobacteriaceae bacterium]|nr:3-ketoacyl-ACP reductase [Cyclobacteriaceae bacterium]
MSKNKTALVTGGSRGIGLGIARALAKEGIHLAINGVRDESAVTDVLDELRSYGVEVIYARGDIGSASDREEMVKLILRKFGHINYLINNAGVAPKERKDILEATEESFEYVIRTNLTGSYFLTQAIANTMIRQKNENPGFEAAIINISSISATVASVNRGEYCIAKAGISMATQLFAVRLGEFDIPVYEVRPGIIETDMTAGVKEKYDNLIANGLCVQKRWGKPEDIGSITAVLVRGQMPYATGQVIVADGGLTIGRL